MMTTVIVHGDAGTHAGAQKLIPELEAVAGRSHVFRFFQAYLATRLMLFGGLALGLLIWRRQVLAVFNVDPASAFIVPFVAVIVVLEGASSALGDLNSALLENKLLNMVGAFIAIFQPALILAAVNLGLGFQGILVALTASAALKLLLLGAATARLRSGVSVGPVRSTPGLWSRFVRLSISGYVDKLVNYVYSWPVVVLLLASHMRGEEVALFALSARFVTQALTVVLSPVSGVLLPLFATVASSDNRHRLAEVFEATVKGLTWVCVGGAALLIGCVAELLPWLFSSTYESAVPIARILIAAHFIEYSVYAPSNAALIVAERARTFVALKGVALLAVPVFMITVPEARLGTTALIFGIVRVGVALILLCGALRIHRLHYPARSASKIAACGAITVLILIAVPLGLIAKLLIGGAVFIGCSKVLRVFGPHERARIARVLRPYLRPDCAPGRIVLQLI
jgi:O-antigen/teichoic acid export membrane protein